MLSELSDDDLDLICNHLDLVSGCRLASIWFSRTVYRAWERKKIINTFGVIQFQDIEEVESIRHDLCLYK